MASTYKFYNPDDDVVVSKHTAISQKDEHYCVTINYLCQIALFIIFLH